MFQTYIPESPVGLNYILNLMLSMSSADCSDTVFSLMACVAPRDKTM
jgi:hypothetical protein